MLPRKIALICGGPSPERGISLNSARSVMDHLRDVVDVVPFYVDLDKNFYQLDPALLYSNTPSDFDFKLHTNTAAVILGKGDEGALDRGPISYIKDGISESEMGTSSTMLENGSSVCDALRLAEDDAGQCGEVPSIRSRASLAEDDGNIKLSETELIAILKTCDIVFPAIHGDFGETGELQAFLEQNHIPFVGCGSVACRNMYYKDRAAMVLREAGFDTLVSITVNPTSVILGKGTADRGPISCIKDGIFENEMRTSRTMLGNGSLVCGATHLAEDDAGQCGDAPSIRSRASLAEDDTFENIHTFFTAHNITRAIVKPIAGGSSIGVHSVTSAKQAIDIVSKATAPMIIEPFCEGREFTVIVLEGKDHGPVALVPTEIQISYADGAIFDYRRKYLPTNNTMWACPPNFPDAVIQKIRSDAEAIFRLFNMRDFARLDGWVLDDGRIVFTDMNPISGMEQNSFIFQQTSRMGMTHQEALLYLIS